MSIYTLDSETALSAGGVADGDLFLVADASVDYAAKTITMDVLRSSMSAIVATTATALSITKALHANRTVVINSAAPIAITLPQAIGSGDRYRFVVGVAATGTAHTIAVANATDNMNGGLAIFDTSATDITALAFAATATDDRISLDGTTKAGTVGTIVEIEDVKTGLFAVSVRGAATGSYATPFSAAV